MKTCSNQETRIEVGQLFRITITPNPVMSQLSRSHDSLTPVVYTLLILRAHTLLLIITPMQNPKTADASATDIAPPPPQV
mmetsp:Transcript_18708/g.29178  ORF Transcript_18708/g.29178 Transcript_18708/m.29178 type:complete len:80 (+) Transcript_18708:53-292(+)